MFERQRNVVTKSLDKLHRFLGIELNQQTWSLLNKKDRDKKNPKRDHLRNCYRLSRLSKEKVLQIPWRAWSEWLDSKFLSFVRADMWLNRNINKIATLNGNEFRTMTKFYRNNVAKKGKMEFGIFSDEEFNSLWDEKHNEFIATLESED